MFSILSLQCLLAFYEKKSVSFAVLPNTSKLCLTFIQKAVTPQRLWALESNPFYSRDQVDVCAAAAAAQRHEKKKRVEHVSEHGFYLLYVARATKLWLQHKLAERIWCTRRHCPSGSNFAELTRKCASGPKTVKFNGHGDCAAASDWRRHRRLHPWFSSAYGAVWVHTNVKRK